MGGRIESWNRSLVMPLLGSLVVLGVACHQPRHSSAGDSPEVGSAVSVTSPAAAPGSNPALSNSWQRGVSWVAQGVVTAQNFEALKAVGATWIVQTPFGWQRHHDSSEVRLVTSGRVLWGETDEGLRVTTALAKEAGIRTLLKPHLWLTRGDGRWRSDVAMADEDSWQAWFASYETFILHYARLAEELGIEALAVGTELRETVRRRPEDWRRMIGAVRAVYGGQLTYAANWYREFEEVSFWEDLDFIGVQGYFPLTDRDRPTVEELRAGWTEPLAQLRRVHLRTGLPVVFTEIGYKSTANAAVEPWLWPRRRDRRTIPVDLETQERCYEAFFQAVRAEPWIAGAFFWKWFPHHELAGGGDDIGFTPQNKPAETALARGYRL